MQLNDSEMIHVIWEEINNLSPDEREKEIHYTEKEQSAISRFIDEELEGLDSIYTEKAHLWLYFCLKVLKTVFSKEQLPKLELQELREKIEAIEDNIGPDDIEDFLEHSSNMLLEHIIDLISHLESGEANEEVEIVEDDKIGEDLDSYESSYEDISIEGEGDEDYMMFQEMYDSREAATDSEGELSPEEDARYSLFLIFNTVMELFIAKIGDKKKK